MAKPEPKMPKIEVRNQTRVTLSADEVDHALRCWLSQGGAASCVPKVPTNLTGISLTYHVDGEDGSLIFVEAVYEPRAD